MDRSLTLAALAEALRGAEVFRNKCRIRPMVELFAGQELAAGIRNGDDAAAIPDGDGYLLLAAEGIVDALVRRNPYLAGRCAVLANVNDIYAMGGRPLAMVDVIGTPDEGTAREICRGMRDAAARYRVPVVGGHLLRTGLDHSASLAILGRAKACLTSFDARPGDSLVLVTRPNGVWLGELGFWNATLPEDDDTLLAHLELLPACAEAGLARAGKDVSMAGLAGTALMLVESSGVGCRLDVDALAPPPGAPLAQWLLAFMSYGFLLAVAPDKLDAVAALFTAGGVRTVAVGEVCEKRQVWLTRGEERALLWDLETTPFVGGAP